MKGDPASLPPGPHPNANHLVKRQARETHKTHGLGSAECGDAPCLLTPGSCWQSTDGEPRLETVLHRWPGWLPQSPTRKAAVGFYPQFTAGETETAKPVSDGDCACLLQGSGVTCCRQQLRNNQEKREITSANGTEATPVSLGPQLFTAWWADCLLRSLGEGDLILGGEGQGHGTRLCPPISSLEHKSRRPAPGLGRLHPAGSTDSSLLPGSGHPPARRQPPPRAGYS